MTSGKTGQGQLLVGDIWSCAFRVFDYDINLYSSKHYFVDLDNIQKETIQKPAVAFATTVVYPKICIYVFSEYLSHSSSEKS
jgi:hypothetical protein